MHFNGLHYQMHIFSYTLKAFHLQQMTLPFIISNSLLVLFHLHPTEYTPSNRRKKEKVFMFFRTESTKVFLFSFFFISSSHLIHHLQFHLYHHHCSLLLCILQKCSRRKNKRTFQCIAVH